jgi:hypothetical protein
MSYVHEVVTILIAYSVIKVLRFARIYSTRTNLVKAVDVCDEKFASL